MKWIVGALVGLVIAFSISLMIRLGAFKEIQIETSDESELLFIYKEHAGPYHKILPVIQEVENWAAQNDIDCRRSFGQYLDDPDLVEEVRLRSNGGCVVKELPSSLPTDFKTSQILPRKYLKVVFDGSPSIGPMKVYTPVRRLAVQQRLRLASWNLEIYEIHRTSADAKSSQGQDRMTTTYLFPYETP